MSESTAPSSTAERVELRSREEKWRAQPSVGVARRVFVRARGCLDHFPAPVVESLGLLRDEKRSREIVGKARVLVPPPTAPRSIR